MAENAESAASLIQVEVAPGELLDKWSILRIKSERIADPKKLASIRAEFAVVDATRRKHIPATPGLDALLGELKEVNERLWDIENAIRACEKRQDFGSEFARPLGLPDQRSARGSQAADQRSLGRKIPRRKGLSLRR